MGIGPNWLKPCQCNVEALHVGLWMLSWLGTSVRYLPLRQPLWIRQQLLLIPWEAPSLLQQSLTLNHLFLQLHPHLPLLERPVVRKPHCIIHVIIDSCQSSQYILILEGACITIGGPSTGVPCIFPFTFMGITFEKCAYYDGQPACATQVNELGIAIDYGYCGPNCPTLGMKNRHIHIYTKILSHS